MGTEKGILEMGDAPLYQHPLKVLELLCDEILISTCRASLFQVPYQKVCDEIKEIGPLGGIYSCLKQSSNHLNLVLSYDMPLVTESLFRLLIRKQDPYELVLPAMPGKQPEPLCGLYTKSILGAIGQMIEEQDFAVNHLLNHCQSRIVPVSEEMEGWKPNLFLNINSKEDFQHIPPGFGTEQGA